MQKSTVFVLIRHKNINQHSLITEDSQSKHRHFVLHCSSEVMIRNCRFPQLRISSYNARTRFLIVATYS